MKTYLSFGAGIAIGNSLLTLILFFAGYQTDPDKLQSVRWVSGLLGIAIYLVGLCYGLKIRRAEVPVDKPFGYGQAFGAALMISLFALICGEIFQYLYLTVINPGIFGVYEQAQRAALEARGLSDDKVDAQLAMMKKFNTPIVWIIFSGLFIALIDTLASLAVAAFFTRKNPDEAVSL